MRIKRSIKTAVPPVPQSLSGHVNMQSTCVLNNRELMLFEHALYWLDKYITAGNPIVQSVFVNIAYVDADKLEIVFDNQAVLGNHVSFVFYPIHRWRGKKLNDLAFLICTLEELCHALWLVRDEVKVKQMVIDILNMSSGLHLMFDNLFSITDGLPALRLPVPDILKIIPRQET